MSDHLLFLGSACWARVGHEWPGVTRLMTNHVQQVLARQVLTIIDARFRGSCVIHCLRLELVVDLASGRGKLFEVHVTINLIVVLLVDASSLGTKFVDCCVTVETVEL
ncbi:hypothetical protein BDN72DRAFT_854521 [Pluteus cervinus]|uniref:Uncharacterized protein n=1 Tax=Pluteus cervinus TaxID=181527 RepID=A0ACD3B783_9AGAR|nr:hypothetical protein BDN72DRAFT_854521 [Pluteus cervinus]